MHRGIESGFTLIELITVIIILGILSAIALPRFINLNESALEASNKSIAGSLGSAVLGANLAWIIHGNNTAIADMPDYLDNSFNFNSSGYPIESGDKKTSGHSVITTPNANMCARVWNGLFNHSVSLDKSGLGDSNRWYYAVNEGVYRVSTASAGLCEYTMMKNTNRFIRYDTNTGRVTAG